MLFKHAHLTFMVSTGTTAITTSMDILAVFKEIYPLTIRDFTNACPMLMDFRISLYGSVDYD